MKIETDASFYTSDEGFQRSSSLKSFHSCSWLYYCDYVLKLPRENNEGAMMGSVCHALFECLLNPRHKPIYTKIIKNNYVSSVECIEKLIKKLIKKQCLPNTQEVFDKINDMILVGLKTDFYVKGGKIVGKEYRFKIKNESPKYSIYGTIDKIAIKGQYVIIDDFKSSKLKYSGEDTSANIQALMYSLAAKKLWPKHKSKVRFIFLQYPNDPIQEVEFSNEVLMGFEHYLEQTQKKMDAFTEQDARNSFAADKDMPADGSFGGKLQCGYGKYPGHKNKLGKEYWVCPFKWSYDYYVLINNGMIIKSAIKQEDLSANENETIEKRHYDGCPRYQQPLEDMTPKLVKMINNNELFDF